MSKGQYQKFRLIRTLLKQLQDFGLNPHHWRIHRETIGESDEVSLVHRYDTEFRIQARVRTGVDGIMGQVQLADLQLTSI